MGAVVEPGEPLWTQSDRDVVEGWNAYQDSLCSGCGQPRDQAWSKDEDYRWQGEIKLCRPCEAIDVARDEHRKKGNKDTHVSWAGVKVIANRGEKVDPIVRAGGTRKKS